MEIDEARFWQKVEKSDGCWLWKGGTNRGYGRPRINGVHTYAHRISWELAYGPIPDGIDVLHKCDTPACVRPDHLFLGTAYDNIHDCMSKGRFNRAWGEANGLAKLTIEQVHEIRASNLSGVELGRKFGVCKSLISQVRKNKIWKGV